jgi:hypothetical protein
MAMMAITTSSSISVNAERLRRDSFMKVLLGRTTAKKKRKAPTPIEMGTETTADADECVPWCSRAVELGEAIAGCEPKTVPGRERGTPGRLSGHNH